MTDARSTLAAALSDRYRIERELSGGGMSRVFLAREHGLDRDVVIKVLPTDIAAGVSADRFAREIQVVASLQQANIVPLLAAGNADGVPFYTMPFVEGESLRVRLTKGSPTVRESVDILRDVARALSYAHAHGVVHRDIKPDNILISHGAAVVTDFGIAKAVTAARTGDGGMTLTQAGLSIGTPAYMAPEQVTGEPNIDHRADIYSWGCLAYELLAGRPPFVAESTHKLLAAHLAESPEPLLRRRPEVSPALAQLVMRCLEKDTASRPATADEILRALEGVRTSDDSGSTIARSPAPSRPGWMIPVAAALVVVAVAALAMTKDRREPPAAAVDIAPSLVVLPFTNMGGAPENEIFADGITEDVITQLATIGGLTVISRTTAMTYKGTTKPLKQVAAELGVGALLEGSVRRIGSRVRVVAQLIDAKTDAHLWADTFDRELLDVFQIQSEVAQAIADTLRVTLSPTKRAELATLPTRDTLAYQLYIRARAAFADRSPGSMRTALDLAQRAIDRDTSFAAAYALKGSILLQTPFQSTMREVNAYPAARAALDKALALKSELPEARAGLGFLLFLQDYDRQGSEREFQKALALGPGRSDVLNSYTSFLGFLGRFDDAIRVARESMRLDPQSPTTIHNLGLWQYAARQYDDALASERRALEMTPENQTIWNVRWQASWTIDRMDDAIESLVGLLATTDSRALRADELREAMAKGGKPALTRLLLARWPREVRPLNRAIWFSELGERDSAMAVLEQAYIERRASLLYQLRFPTLDGMRGDPRYLAFMRKVGLEP
jgi:eukaryotic-like serine/threonine-protein kinase